MSGFFFEIDERAVPIDVLARRNLRQTERQILESRQFRQENTDLNTHPDTDPRGEQQMKCPHCLENFHEVTYAANIMVKKHTMSSTVDVLVSDGIQAYYATNLCPACSKPTVYLTVGGPGYMAYPKGISRAPLPAEVGGEFADDYKEACLVLADSPKASAALSRRCLQHLLREKAKTKKKDLADQIQEVLDARTLPSQLADNLDAIRNIGNFATHTQKSTNSGEILDVEPGEAEWSLEVLEELFDFFIVAPAGAKAKRDALNQKLAEAGKPQLKS